MLLHDLDQILIYGSHKQVILSTVLSVSTLCTLFKSNTKQYFFFSIEYSASYYNVAPCQTPNIQLYICTMYQLLVKNNSGYRSFLLLKITILQDHNFCSVWQARSGLTLNSLSVESLLREWADRTLACQEQFRDNRIKINKNISQGHKYVG